MQQNGVRVGSEAQRESVFFTHSFHPGQVAALLFPYGECPWDMSGIGFRKKFVFIVNLSNCTFNSPIYLHLSFGIGMSLEEI